MGFLSVHEIFLPVQSSTWRFDVDTVASYTITVTCDDGKTGGTVTGTSVVSLTPNLAPSITNMPGSLLFCFCFAKYNSIQCHSLPAADYGVQSKQSGIAAYMHSSAKLQSPLLSVHFYYHKQIRLLPLN